MTVSFNPNLATAIDRIRQRIGDVDQATAEVQDETISAYVAQGLSELKTAARLCRDIAAKYARMGDVTLDRQMTRASQIYEHFIALAVEIETEAKPAAAGQGDSASGSAIYVAGLDDCRGPIDSRGYIWGRC